MHVPVGVGGLLIPRAVVSAGINRAPIGKVQTCACCLRSAWTFQPVVVYSDPVVAIHAQTTPGCAQLGKPLGRCGPQCIGCSCMGLNFFPRHVDVFLLLCLLLPACYRCMMLNVKYLPRQLMTGSTFVADFHGTWIRKWIFSLLVGHLHASSSVHLSFLSGFIWF